MPTQLRDTTLAAKRAGGKILTLSATAADSVMKLRSLGFILGLHSMDDRRHLSMNCWVLLYLRP